MRKVANYHAPVKPCISIYIFPHDGCDEKIREVTAGMEEEGIPYAIVKSEVQSAVMLAHTGAGQSQLGVGVGISTGEMCIHYQKLAPDQPLFVSNEKNPQVWRCFGYNAARLVKGIPFKTLAFDEQPKNFAPKLEQQVDSLDLYQLVSGIVNKILQESAQGHGEV